MAVNGEGERDWFAEPLIVPVVHFPVQCDIGYVSFLTESTIFEAVRSLDGPLFACNFSNVSEGPISWNPFFFVAPTDRGAANQLGRGEGPSNTWKTESGMRGGIISCPVVNFRRWRAVFMQAFV
jgi:hypothetical protein